MGSGHSVEAGVEVTNRLFNDIEDIVIYSLLSVQKALAETGVLLRGLSLLDWLFQRSPPKK